MAANQKPKVWHQAVMEVFSSFSKSVNTMTPSQIKLSFKMVKWKCMYTLQMELIVNILYTINQSQCISLYNYFNLLSYLPL